MSPKRSPRDRDRRHAVGAGKVLVPPPRPGERGQATVEFVLVLPIIVVMILATIQVGVVVHQRVLLAHVAREAARAGATEPSLAAATTAGNNATGLSPERLRFGLSGGRLPGDRLVVTVDYRAETAVPIVGALVPDFDFTTEVTVRVE